MSKRKRFRKRKAKPGQLLAYFARPERGAEPEVVYAWGGSGACSADGRVLAAAFEDARTVFGTTLVEELCSRGYDIATLSFSISMPAPVQHPPVQQEESNG